MVQHPPKPRPHRKRENAVPEEIEKTVVRFAERLRTEFGTQFTSRRMKRNVARLLESALPPYPRQPGRPGLQRVTAAIRLRDELRQSHPHKSMKWIWRRIYRRLIPGYRTLPPIDRKEAENRLRRQVRWRLYARRRRPRTTQD